MASVPFTSNVRRAHAIGMPPEDPNHSRWTRYADTVAAASVCIGLLVGLFGILDYQYKAMGNLVKGEIAPLAVAIAEMDKRLTGKIDETNRRIDGLDRRIDGLDRRIDGLAKEVGDLNTRVGRLEGKAGK